MPDAGRIRALKHGGLAMALALVATGCGGTDPSLQP
jgi:hypothetical protein